MKRQPILQRALAVLLSFCIAFVIQYSLYYVGTHLEHKCTGRDCTVCHQIMMAQKMVKQLSHFSGVAFSFVVFRACLLQCILLPLRFISERTLISDKVRLDA